jgi:hypothetical protein
LAYLRRYLVRRLALLILVVAATPLVSAGCGASTSSSHSPNDVAQRFIRDLGKGDGKDGCSLMSQQLRTHYNRARGSSCADVFQAATRSLTDRQRAKYADVTLHETTTIHGNTATLEDPTGTMQLLKRNGRWLVNSGSDSQ